MNSKDKLILLIVIVVMTITCILLGFHKNNATFSHVYQVYLDGEKVGLVDNKNELFTYKEFLNSEWDNIIKNNKILKILIMLVRFILLMDFKY